MGVLLKNPQLNWLPKNAFFFRLVDDIIDVDGKIVEDWIREDLTRIKEVKLYVIDLRNRNHRELIAFREIIELLISRKMNTSSMTEFYDEITYMDLLTELTNSLKQQILLLDKSE